MVERGGPATQAGIVYQNTVAALFMGRMLDLRQRPVHERVVHVRLEAPAHVDDIVVRMADGHRKFIQAKLKIAKGTPNWKRLWHCFDQQLASAAREDKVCLWSDKSSALMENLRECVTRSRSAEDHDEFMRRLSPKLRGIIMSIAGVLASAKRDARFVRELLKRVEIEIVSKAVIERDYVPLWMPAYSGTGAALMGALRDLAGNTARVRGAYHSQTLREELKKTRGIEINEPEDWGAAAYRQALTAKTVLEVPGSGFERPAEDIFLWPRAERYDRSRHSDFEDDTPRWIFSVRPDAIDLSLFPAPGLDRIIVVAGPGFGKSALTFALTGRMLRAGRLPVVIPITLLSDNDTEVAEHLAGEVNSVFNVNVDWLAAAESGLLVLLFDGLDEVSSARRTVVLERIKTFAMRYPSVPWVITVRDAAALAAPAGGVLVELQPLNDAEIERFANLYKPSEKGYGERLLQVLRARPELHRLVRIPLFLALLVTSSDGKAVLPSSRSELIEQYLSLLFGPEQFKRTERDATEPAIVRNLSELLAYEALEREDIGVSERLLQMTILKQSGPGTSAQAIIERLLKCGILRRRGPGRFEFPFPIIQEYLAAHHLLTHHPTQIAYRFASVAKRPWAQTLQFALEGHTDPVPLLDKLLGAEDDAFHTHLRLVARCIVNGMKVPAQFRAEVGNRLGRIWPKVTWRLRDRIGDLIYEGFSEPLTAELRELLHLKGVQTHGAGRIVERASDDELTYSVLQRLVGGYNYSTLGLLNLYELQSPVDKIAPRAFTLYVAFARKAISEPDGRKSDEMLQSMACLIEHLADGAVPDDEILRVVADKELPVIIRVGAAALMAGPLDEGFLPLVEAALEGPEFPEWQLAAKALAKTPAPLRFLKQMLLRKRSAARRNQKLVTSFIHDLPESKRREAGRAIADDTELSQPDRLAGLVLAARYGDTDAMTRLVDKFSSLPPLFMGVTLSLFGHHKSAELAEKAVAKIRKRKLAPRIRVRLSAETTTGMTSLYMMDWFSGGTLEPTSTHPGIGVVRSLIEEWSERDDYTPVGALDLDNNLLRLGSDRPLSRMQARIEAVLKANDIDLMDHNVTHHIGHAITNLRDHGRWLDLAFLERITKVCSYNAVSGAVSMMAARGTQDDFDALMALHARSDDRSTKDNVLDALETLSSRLGTKVRSVNGVLEAVAL